MAPVSIDPKHQNKGIHSQLIREGLKLLQGINTKVCVLLGEPAYYQRFGFEAFQQLVLPDVPAEYFQALSFCDSIPDRLVTYHQAFG